LGSCDVMEDVILNTFSAAPDKCSKLCKINDNCDFWKARWDGTQCYLLTSNYQHDCGSFAGPINWLECNEGADSCYAFIEDQCVYNGERIESDEPSPGDISSIDGCRLWAELWVDDGAEFFHYNATSEECHLYRTLSAACQAVGGPKDATSFEQCAATTTTTTTSVPSTKQGLLVLGGAGGDWTTQPKSIEFWSPDKPDEGSCVLKDYPRNVTYPTVNFVSDRLVVCESRTCEVFQEGSWRHLQNTLENRYYHSSIATQEAVLLIGGGGSRDTSEWIPIDGSPAYYGPNIRHDNLHCTMQIDDHTIVVTGGMYTWSYVTEYKLDDSSETPLTPMLQPRWEHACAVYQDSLGQQVLLVTGGESQSGGEGYLSSTEVAVYTSDVPLQWRELKNGNLPSKRYGGRIATVDNVIHLAGCHSHLGFCTEILAFDPVSESWIQRGEFALPRYHNGAVGVPASAIASDCLRK